MMATSVDGSWAELEQGYSLCKPIGHGAYGLVCSAIDVSTQRRVAIKRVKKIFDSTSDSKRILREIRLLRMLHHENIVELINIPLPSQKKNFQEIYLVYELMDCDLHQIIASAQPLSDDHCQYFLYQILKGLKFLHSANILHRDLKPSNLLVNENCDLKICDFGLARKASDHNFAMTEYVATRWYRAPEIMLNASNYSPAIDIWAVGCILAELLARKPLFPGKDYIHQLNLIIDVVGLTEQDMDYVRNEQARNFLKNLPPKRKQNFHNLFPNASPLAIDMLDKLLTFHPAKRITVDQALAHPYLSSLHDPNDEPVATGDINMDFDRSTLNSDQLRDLIYDEIMHFHPDTMQSKADNMPMDVDGASCGSLLVQPDAPNPFWSLMQQDSYSNLYRS